MLKVSKRVLSVILSMVMLGASSFSVYAQEQHEHNMDCDHEHYVLVDDTYYTLDEYLEKLNAEVDSYNEAELKSSTIEPCLFGCSNVFGHKWEWGPWRGGSIQHASACLRGFTGDFMYGGCRQTITRTATCSRTYCNDTNTESDILIVYCYIP